jgi:DNA-3-methyladenine glycosylase
LQREDKKLREALTKLAEEFYQRTNVVQIARELLGKTLYTRIDGIMTGGMIVETEAYSWKERGSHAYNNRRTTRNEIMFGTGGFTYVYLCYGIHNLFNVVTNRESVAEAVLIRALEPVAGEEYMIKRTKAKNSKKITSGPGKLTKALGIDRKMNAKYLLEDEIWIEDAAQVAKNKIVTGSRIGIDYAGEDASLPWRFQIKDNPWVSKP